MTTLPSNTSHHGQSLLAAVSDAMVTAMKEYYGKGPTRVKSYMVDDYLFIAMRDPLTVVEKTLLRAGREDLVREYRQAFQNEMTGELCGQIAELTGRRVLTYQSQVVFNPDTLFEIFVLEPAEEGGVETPVAAELVVAEASPEATDA
ncbi:MAG: hypothetical protein AVDCRST_MAG45-1983 [uncultured Solirubrobacterales bacterium]|uniref:Na+-translocating membrane potential-generating system MpsC domain-containing protein n=1 Tax=uncultured Solirubrobacterales bacterium TaxID=768556 RepID=A0A6J4T2J5_9ACTN|nr:MAG: hypothetical protein AVDCRST_MAG45-1983 [uncultured Solirubrobacterales bacterium]